MILRKVLGALLVLGALEGCKAPGSCEQDAECPQAQFCDKNVNMCFSNRYSALSITLSPPLQQNNFVGGGPLRVEGRLTLDPGSRPVYPAQLNLNVTPPNGTPTSITLQSTAEGTYSAEWTPPPGEGTYTLEVAHPESWGPRDTLQVKVDRTAPVLALQVPEAQPAAPKDGFSYADPQADKAWARDQTVTARVEVEEDPAGFDPADLRVVVKGHAGGTNVTDLTVNQVTTSCTKAYCGTVDVPLWRPGLEAFRGDFQLEVTAKDKVGNERSASGTIPVTRWKWVFDGATGPILSTPAIGDKGTIYFGTSDTNGKVFALNPEGTLKWQNPLGPVSGSPAVGRTSDGTDRVYVGAAPAVSGGVLFSLDGNNGNPTAQCPEEGRNLGWEPVVSGVAITSASPGPGFPSAETGIAITRQFTSPRFQPDFPGSCSSLGGQTALVGASVITKGADYYFSTFAPTLDPSPDAPPFDMFIDAFSFGSGGGVTTKQGYNTPNPRAPVTGMALVESNRGTLTLVAAGLTSPKQGGVEAHDATEGRSAAWRYPASFEGVAPVRNLAIGAGNVVFFGHEDSTGSAPLTAIDLFSTAPRASVPNAGSFPGSPVLGASGVLYTASATGPAAAIGEVSVWSANDLTLRWKLSDSVGRAQASPSLDCARQADGTPAAQPKGVLYVPGLDGRLYALVVDSPGLEKNAPWPKYQHDARNTGNVAMPITNCP
ncbi:PQQ-binding-like beta-propeller repeat protein [Archangium lansingense]|uniref:PQQ-binding-like beta-propeller repeat protein n=1 Tax=Archangium lansingense TaxID=2995310 RepID=A0ABT4AIU4_9BACT|nr:PQQ-binding-like beta-propeller repeat protein [Archangium lansinium]MCY1081550.1 PQQ-binding-like beta-propeller repeat protein [Archangium lansinium]